MHKCNFITGQIIKLNSPKNNFYSHFNVASLPPSNYKTKVVHFQLAKYFHSKPRSYSLWNFSISSAAYSFSPSSSSSSVADPVPQNKNKMETFDERFLKRYTIPSNPPVITIDCDEAFNALSLQEKLYAHYLSQACWVGGLIVSVQTSPESPAILSVLLDAFKTNGIDGLRSIAENKCGFSHQEWEAFLAYACGIISEMGNYKGYGDTKIIPALPEEKLSKLMTSCSFSRQKSLELYLEVKTKLYSLTKKEQQLGLGEEGITTYFSANCTQEDADIIGRFLMDRQIEPWNTRAFKTVDDMGHVNYEIRSASSAIDDDMNGVQKFNFEDTSFSLTKGDYSPLMKMVSDYLIIAKDYALNYKEKEMLNCYITSFTEGSLGAHKEGSRWWVKDQSPVIETYIGFIENYRDPVGARSEFEGFVSVVNKPLSIKFENLVKNADKILQLLPWPKEFERKTFMKPDFTSLDIICFAGSGIPVGINIPNYDEIRLKDGFKNVTLGNSIVARLKDVDHPFFSDADNQLLKEYIVRAFELQTGLHELLGHGSGTIFTRNDDGTSNLPEGLCNPITKELITTIYNPGETYNSVFADLGSPYEECRAETIGLLLSLNLEVHKIFGFGEEESKKVRLANWLTALYDGVRSLDLYQPDAKKWMQAHSQAAFVTMQVLIEAGQGLVKIEEIVGSDGKPDLRLSLSEDLLETVALKATSDFILKLQVFKATADIKSAREMFDGYSSVSDVDPKHPWLTWRDIVIDRKPPRKMCNQVNTVVSDDLKSVLLKSYDRSPEGMLTAWIERLPDVDIVSPLQKCYEDDKSYFPSCTGA